MSNKIRYVKMRYATNFEYIRSKNSEEFAEFMKDKGCPPSVSFDGTLKCHPGACKDCWWKWLGEKGPEIGKLEV